MLTAVQYDGIQAKTGSPPSAAAEKTLHLSAAELKRPPRFMAAGSVRGWERCRGGWSPCCCCSTAVQKQSSRSANICGHHFRDVKKELAEREPVPKKQSVIAPRFLKRTFEREEKCSANSRLKRLQNAALGAFVIL